MKDIKNKGGRPAMENKKKFRINVRFDETEHKRVLKNAETAGMSKSEWVRKSAVERKSLRASLSTDQALAGVQPFGTVL